MIDNFPLKGLGTYKLLGSSCTDNVLFALENGVKLIDTASFYENEKAVGNAISQTTIKREAFQITTKMWTDEMRSSTAENSLLKSLDKLQTDYVDYYLVHWPVKEKWQYAYEQMLVLQQKGLVKKVGVCNCAEAHLREIKDSFGSYPFLNQIEAHPNFQQKEMQQFCKDHAIQMQSWRTLMFGEVETLTDLKGIAEKYEKSVYQVALKFFVQNGVGVIPKSSSKSRILENFNIDDFQLSTQDLQRISELDKNERNGPHPNNFDF
ncbi:MAG: aldo/keto reductase [Lishizhenia sp.]